MNLSMWKFDENQYAFQTDSKEIAEKLKRRHSSKLLNYSINKPHWVFLLMKNNSRDAINTFKTLSGKKPIYIKTKDVWEI